MATWFVDGTAGSDSNAGTSWAVPFQTLSHALSASAAGDVIACGSTGSFTANAAITLTPPAGAITIVSALNPGSGTTITPASGATISVGAATAALTVGAVAGASIEMFGMTLIGGTNLSSSCTISLLGNATANCSLEARNCTFTLPAAGVSAALIFGANTSGIGKSQSIRLINPTVNITGSRAGTPIFFNGADTTIVGLMVSQSGATVPASLFRPSSVSSQSVVKILDSDLSGFNTSGGAYFDVTNLQSNMHVQMENCRLSATPSLTTGTWSFGFGDITLRNCASGATFYTLNFINAFGTLTATTSISRSSGAQFAGSGISWEIQTTSLCGAQTPFYPPPISLWGATTSAETPTVEIIFDATAPNPTAALDNTDIWPNIDFNGSTSYPLGSYVTGRNAQPVLGTGVAWNMSAATWSGVSGFTNPIKQTLNPAGNGNTITPAVAGLLQTSIGIAVPSATVYIDPFVNGVT